MELLFPDEEYDADMEPHGRFVLPEAFRGPLDTLEGLLLMTCYRPGFVVIVPEKQFANSLASHEKVSVDRWRVSLSRPADFDEDWSIVISSPLREIARLKKDLIICGKGDRLEIWDRESKRAEEIDYDS